MVASHHDDLVMSKCQGKSLRTHLDAGTPALSHCIGDGGLGRVNHAHQADEAEAIQGKVGLVPLSGELETLREVGGVEVDKAKDLLTHASQGLAGLGEGLLHLLGQSNHLPLQQDCIAPYKEDSWEHHEETSTLRRPSLGRLS